MCKDQQAQLCVTDNRLDRQVRPRFLALLEIQVTVEQGWNENCHE